MTPDMKRLCDVASQSFGLKDHENDWLIHLSDLSPREIANLRGDLIDFTGSAHVLGALLEVRGLMMAHRAEALSDLARLDGEIL